REALMLLVRVPLPKVTAPPPRAPALPTCSTPPATTVPPVNVLTLLRTIGTVPPAMVNVLDPLTLPLNVTLARVPLPFAAVRKVLLVRVTGPVKTALAVDTPVLKAMAPLKFTGLLTTAGLVMSGENVPPVSVRGPEPKLVML